MIVQRLQLMDSVSELLVMHIFQADASEPTQTVIDIACHQKFLLLTFRRCATLGTEASTQRLADTAKGVM